MLTKEEIAKKQVGKKRERVPLAEALPIVRCPGPSLLPLLPQGPEAALRALVWGGGWLTKNPSRESLPGCHDEVSFLGVFASIKRVARAEVRALPHLRAPGDSRPTPPCPTPVEPTRPVNWPRVN